MRRPRIYKGPAAAYESAGECIREVSIGDGTGALIAVRRWEGTRPLVQLYRVDPSVRVSVGFDDGHEPIRDLIRAASEVLRVNRTQGVTDTEYDAAVEALDAAIVKAEART